MKMRRVIVQVEIETDTTLDALKMATLRVEVPCRIKYLEENRVNVVRPSTAKRKSGKQKEKAK